MAIVDQDIINDFRRLLEARGISGQLEVRTEDGASRTQWIGKPNDDDLIIVVTVKAASK